MEGASAPALEDLLPRAGGQGAPLPPLPPLPGSLGRGPPGEAAWEEPRSAGKPPRRPLPFPPPASVPASRVAVLEPGQRPPAWPAALPLLGRGEGRAAGVAGVEGEVRVPSAFRYALRAGDGGPRALRWEEARLGFVPTGVTLRGVVEEVRPYGAFIGLTVNSTYMHMKGGEDSRIRGFCETAELGPASRPPLVGEQLAVKVIQRDNKRQRIYVSALQAEPPWSNRPPEPPKTAEGRPSDRLAAGLLGYSG